MKIVPHIEVLAMVKTFGFAHMRYDFSKIVPHIEV